MKKLVALLSLCTLIVSQIKADDWDLIQPYKETFYCIDRAGAEFNSRYEVDSVVVNTDGSRTYLINYKYREELFSECSDWNLVYWPFASDPEARDYISIDSVLIDNGIHTMTYGADTLIIDTYLSVGESISNNVYTVTCVEEEYISFLGTMDSIKVFTILDSAFLDTLILTKNHGILEGPYLYDVLTGNENISRLSLSATEIDDVLVGVRSDDMLLYIPYEEGDSIVMRYSDITGPGFGDTDTLITVINSRIVDQDTLWLNATQTRINLDDYTGTTTTTVNTIDLIYDLNFLQEGLDYAIHYYVRGFPTPIIFPEPSIDAPIEDFLVELEPGYDSDLQLRTMTYKNLGSFFLADECIVGHFTDNSKIMELAPCYGLIDIEKDIQWVIDSSFELLVEPNSTSDCLNTSNGISDCTSADWETILNTSISSFSESGITIYPNPSENYVSIRSYYSAIRKVSFINMQGLELFHSASAGKALDVSALIPGVYFVLIEHSNGHSLEKFTKI